MGLLATSGFLVVGGKPALVNGNHGQAVAGLDLVGLHVCAGGDCHGKSGTYKPTWLTASARVVKNPVKSMTCRKWRACVRVWACCTTGYLGEHSLSVGIMISPIYGTM